MEMEYPDTGVWILCSKVLQKVSFAIEKRSTKTTYYFWPIPYLHHELVSHALHASVAREVQQNF